MSPTLPGRHRVSCRARLLDAYSGRAGIAAVMTASMLAADRPSVSARAPGRPRRSAMRGVRGLGDLQDRRRLPSRDPHTSSRGHRGQGSPGCLGSGGSHVATVDETTACHDLDRVVTSDCETAKAWNDARSASLERPAVTAPGRRRRAYGRRHTERHHTSHTAAYARDRAA